MPDERRALGILKRTCFCLLKGKIEFIMTTKYDLNVATASALLGLWGEAEAARYLEEQKGFHILERNWRNPGDRRQELDLVWPGR